MVHNPTQGLCMMTRVSRCTPHAGDAKLTTAAIGIVKGAIDLPPSVTAANFDPPEVHFGVFERSFNILFRVFGASHAKTSE